MFQYPLLDSARPMYFRCYVLTCEESTIICAVHPRLGRVAACTRHNPLRYGDVRELDGSRVSRVSPTPPPTDPGLGATRSTPPATTPPSDGAALILESLAAVLAPHVAREMMKQYGGREGDAAMTPRAPAPGGVTPGGRLLGDAHPTQDFDW